MALKLATEVIRVPRTTRIVGTDRVATFRFSDGLEVALVVGTTIPTNGRKRERIKWAQKAMPPLNGITLVQD